MSTSLSHQDGQKLIAICVPTFMRPKLSVFSGPCLTRSSGCVTYLTAVPIIPYSKTGQRRGQLFLTYQKAKRFKVCWIKSCRSPKSSSPANR